MLQEIIASFLTREIRRSRTIVAPVPKTVDITKRIEKQNYNISSSTPKSDLTQGILFASVIFMGIYFCGQDLSELRISELRRY